MTGIKIKEEVYSTQPVDRKEELILRGFVVQRMKPEKGFLLKSKTMHIDTFVGLCACLGESVRRRAMTKTNLIRIMMEELDILGIESKLIQSDGSEVFISFKKK